MAIIRRALLSVSDKSGLADLAAQLQRRGIELLSTGGTAALLEAEGLAVRQVSDYTGFPELMDGRLKTLHPLVHGGLLGRRGIDDPLMRQHGIEPIDLLVVNLYPFAQMLARADATYAELIEHIDIGGPAMLRAAAKNHVDVTVLVDPADYTRVLGEIEANGETSIDTRAWLAAKAFEHTAQYDARIAAFLQQRAGGDAAQFPQQLTLSYEKRAELRYGENPHQRAAWYRRPGARGATISTAKLLQGKELSFNNIADADTALECVRRFARPCCAIIKHANPCGVAVADGALGAYQLAYRADSTSAYGGIIAFNRPIDAACAAAIVNQQFAEVIGAPVIDAAARALFAERPNLRLMETGDLNAETDEMLEARSVGGGLLVQEPDIAYLDAAGVRFVSQRRPDEKEMADLLFAWQVVQFVKSNAIVFAHESVTVGIGAGQMSRLQSVRIAALKAREQPLLMAGAVMASDAFFPFRDGIDEAATHGITAVIHPGGSRRDAEVIAAADEHGMAMVMTDIRHFRH